MTAIRGARIRNLTTAHSVQKGGEEEKSFA